MNQTDALIIIVKAIYDSLGGNERGKVVAEICNKLRELNKDLKTTHTNGATQVADLAEKITGKKDYKLSNGFDE